MNFSQLLKNMLRKLTGPKQVELPAIAAADLEQAKTDDWEYLQVLLDAYAESVQPKIPQNVLAAFSPPQAILILYSDLYGQVANGGFIQLIQNGYGNNLFGNPFAEDIARWGATEIADIVTQAKPIYTAHRRQLERRLSLDEFSKLYQEFTAFEPLEDRFNDVMDGQTAIIRAYVEQHLGQFARVV